MISRYAWYLREMLKKIWVPVIGFALLALSSAGLARVLSPFLPEDIALQTGSEAVGQLLGILTSSMLAVTTFSLSIAVSAFAAASNSATPRVTALLQEDRTTQNVLATFLGAFVFGLIGLIALYARFYDDSGKVVLFIITVLVIGLVVVALIRWISHLMDFGRMADTLDRVEEATSLALGTRLENPYLGGHPLSEMPRGEHKVVAATATGDVQHIDMQALQTMAEEIDTRIYVRALPGSFVACRDALLVVEAPSLTEDQRDELLRAITIGPRRTFEEDPRYGLIVLSEIASRALSPAVNDPGTAIDILGRLTRILSQWCERTDAEVMFDRIFVPPITADAAIDDAFRPIARDGAALVEVQVRLQFALASLARIAPEVFADPASRMSSEALQRAASVVQLESDMELIRKAARCS